MRRYILNSLKEQRMAGRTIRLNWEEWKEYCAEHELNPHETHEDGHDLGGGDSYDVVCYDEPPRREVNDDQNEQFLDEGPSRAEEGDK